jgi:hypothetical protein
MSLTPIFPTHFFPCFVRLVRTPILVVMIDLGILYMNLKINFNLKKLDIPVLVTTSVEMLPVSLY